MLENLWSIFSTIPAIINYYLDKIIIFIIILIIGFISGKTLGIIVDKVVGRMGLESVFRKLSMGRAIMRSGYSPQGFFSTLTRVLTYIFAFLLALDQLTIVPLSSTIHALFNYTPSFFEGTIILLAGFIFSDWVGELIEKGSLAIESARFMSSVTRMLLYVFSIIMALSQMKVNVTVLYNFAQALSWGFAFAFGFIVFWSFKDEIRDLIKEKSQRKQKPEDEAD